jgi:hypothetical protein
MYSFVIFIVIESKIIDTLQLQWFRRIYIEIDKILKAWSEAIQRKISMEMSCLLFLILLILLLYLIPHFCIKLKIVARLSLLWYLFILALPNCDVNNCWKVCSNVCHNKKHTQAYVSWYFSKKIINRKKIMVEL